MPGSNNVDCLTDQVEIYQHFLLEATTSLRLRIIYLILCFQLLLLPGHYPVFSNNSLWVAVAVQMQKKWQLRPAKKRLLFLLPGGFLIKKYYLQIGGFYPVFAPVKKYYQVANGKCHTNVQIIVGHCNSFFCYIAQCGFGDA